MVKYRAEIDGLRAVAVLPVIFFHANLPPFSGGFVGVDVFFVISGYLITSIILEELKTGTFSLADFYERRARRILPALFLIMAACIPPAWALLMPSDLKDFAKSLIAVPLFASNFLFWQQSGYFEAASELKPLLHTWSLAVEEQYYLLFPLLLIGLKNLSLRQMASLIVLIAAASLALAQWGTRHHPDAAFFLLPTRAWELAAGTLTAFILANPKANQPHPSRDQVASAAGLLMIGWAVFFFGKETPFPGFYALLPAVGTALIILYARSHTFIGSFLSCKAMVSLGLISYSAYLWHHPLFAFAKHQDFIEPNRLTFAALSGLSLVLAYLTWRFIEQPVRTKRIFSRQSLAIAAVGLSAVFVGLGFLANKSANDSARLRPEQLMFLSEFENERPGWNYFEKNRLFEKYRDECNFFDTAAYRQRKDTRIPRASIAQDCTNPGNASHTVFLWGDSHAQQLFWGLKQALPAGWKILQVASSGCPPAVVGSKNENDYCAYSNWFALEKIKALQPTAVIIAQHLGHDIKTMRQIAGLLKEKGVGKVIFTGPTPQWRVGLPNLVATKFLPDVPQRTLLGLKYDVIDADRNLKSRASQQSDFRYISVIDHFCNDKGCLVYYGGDVAAGITIWDQGHLTPIASEQFARDVLVKMLLDK